MQQPFFFLTGPAALLLFHRAKRTDLFVNADQILAEFPEPMELGDLLLCLAQRGGIGKRFGHAFAGDPPGQTELRVVTGIVRLGAMAGWLTAAAYHSGNRTGPQIAETAEFFEEFGSILFQFTQGFSHAFSFLNVIIRSELRRKKRKFTVTAFWVAHPPPSRPVVEPRRCV